MRRREQEQAELLDGYWTAVSHDRAATPPAELDPGAAAVSRLLVAHLSPPEPEATFVRQLRRRIDAPEPTIIPSRTAEVPPLGAGWPLRRIAAVAGVLLVAVALLSGGVYAALNFIPSPGPPPPRASLEEVRLVAQGVDKSAGFGVRQVGYAFILENPNQDLAAEGGTYRVTAFDLQGGILATDSGSVPVILPGQRLGIGSFLTLTTVGAVDRLHVEIVPGEFIEAESGLTLVVEDVKYRSDAESPKVTGILGNPYGKDIEQVRVSAVAYGVEGIIIGGGSIVVDSIPAGGKRAVEVPLTTSQPPARVELYAAISRLPGENE